ncbi:methylhydantoinase [Arthrobacter cryoconiti]|uniref:Methylhydantoinase n=1 Tax=Arthrobacter cryoconiti TaxID=748907 RepID=A0ABV8R508_9MICC|nr:methylhydantoinase [Arthrobacter cryoconiti]MCC9066770.1 methylhydantoinase [Arthrobacter cryoconiti]
MRIGLRVEDGACQGVMMAGQTKVAEVSTRDAASLSDAAEQTLNALSTTMGANVGEIIVDVGRVLSSRPLSNVAVIRISPRPPADVFHTSKLPRIVEGIATRIMHVRGGHDIRAHELAKLDLATFERNVASLVQGHRNVAITALGANSTDEHEARIADAILAHDSDVRISISHDFFANAFRDRDFTTTLNSALMETGEYLAVCLEQLGHRYFPGAKVSFVKNDGGRASISHLAVRPVHALHPEPASQLVGLALLSGQADGEIIVGSEHSVRAGTTRDGLPTSTSLLRNVYEASLATNAAAIEKYTAYHPVQPLTPTTVVDLRLDRDGPLPFGLEPSFSTQDDAALIGCATAPWTAWIDRLENVASKEDLQRVQRIAEEDAKSIVVQSGGSPVLTRVMEANSYALPYGNPGIVRVRVQAADNSEPGITALPADCQQRVKA